MLTIKFHILIIVLCFVYTTFGEISFISKGQRAELFELTDNEVPIFRINLPDEEFTSLKETCDAINNGNRNNTEIINSSLKLLIEIINNQNFFESFPNTNFTEFLPELPINENGYPTIDYNKLIISNEFVKRYHYENNLAIIIKSANENSYLNIIKILYELNNLEMSPQIDPEFKDLIMELRPFVTVDKNGKFEMKKSEGDHNTINSAIEYIVFVINRQNLFETFPNTNFTEILPELPIDMNGYPMLDDKNFFCTDEELEKFDADENEKFIVFSILNNNDNINLIKVLYTFSQLEMPSNVDRNFNKIIRDYTYPVFIDENGKFQFDKEKMKEFQDSSSNDDRHIDGNYSLFKKFNTKEFYDFIKNYNFNNHTAPSITYGGDFKTKNASMTVKINNQEINFKKITFSLGGQYSKTFPRPGFNVKIRGNEELFGRRQFKLRADATEPSYMRTKLVCDIHNRLGMPSLSANYITLYINNKYMGLYILTDAFKESWIEYVYGEKDTTQLYKSEGAYLSFGDRRGFKNENKDITDYSELYKFLAAITKAKTASDVESVFDLDQFYKEIALEFLMYGWDHIAHNYYLYKNYNNNKWIYLIHDFDFDMGVELGGIKSNSKDITQYTIKDIGFSSAINKFINSNEQKFNETLKEIVNTTFNPEILFPHIDEIKAFIEPYVKLDKTPNEDGEFPGVISKDNENEFFTYKKWEDSTEYGIISKKYYGLKEYILLRYRYICNDYDIQCDQKYMDDSIKLPMYGEENKNNSTVITTGETTSTTASTTTLPITTSTTVVEKTTEATAFPEETPVNSNTNLTCSSELIGYPCCPPELTMIYSSDEYGDWGYDFKKNEWCGLTKYEITLNNSNNEECWAEELGYPCCKKCKVYETDSNGSWGYELNQWCGIIISKCKN